MKQDSKSPDLTQILHAAGKGDLAAQERFANLVYEELKRTAQQIMRWEGNQTLQPTALVNEAYLRIFNQEEVLNAPSRGYFFAAAAQAMRRILVESARCRKSQKRGGRYERLPFDQILDAYNSQDVDLLALDEAVSQLEQLSPRQAKVVHLRWFAEFTVKEVAELLDVSVSTVEQDWRAARAFLKRQLTIADQ